MPPQPPQSSSDDDDCDEGSPHLVVTKRWRWELRTFVAMVVVDLVVFAALVIGRHEKCEASRRLRIWAIGALLLGAPASLLVGYCAGALGFRATYFVDLLLLYVAFAWLSVGSLWCFNAPTCQLTAPWTFWPVYSLLVLTWTTITAMILCLVFASLVSLAIPPLMACAQGGHHNDD